MQANIKMFRCNIGHPCTHEQVLDGQGIQSLPYITSANPRIQLGVIVGHYVRGEGGS